MNINEVLNTCLSNMKASEDFDDVATVSSLKELLSCRRPIKHVHRYRAVFLPLCQLPLYALLLFDRKLTTLISELHMLLLSSS